MQLVSQREFVERYKRGERDFSGMLLQFFDISHMKFSDLVFKKCELMFCTFRNCDWTNVKFEDCKIYWTSFYNGIASNMLLDKCNIELTLFQTFQFSRTKMSNCRLRWIGILFSNAAAVDLSTSTQSKVFTDVGQLTPKEIEEGLRETLDAINRLDVGIRMKFKESIRQDMERYGIALPTDEKKSGGYGSREERVEITYGEVKHMLESTFNAYSHQKAYEMKNPYEKQDGQTNRKRQPGPPF